MKRPVDNAPRVSIADDRPTYGELLARTDLLIAKNLELRHKIEAMEDALRAEVDGVIVQGLTRSERLILGLLARKGRASKETIHQLLHGHDPEGGPHLSSIEVRISILRRKLPAGVEIRAVRGEYYHIPPAGLAILKALP